MRKQRFCTACMIRRQRRHGRFDGDKGLRPIQVYVEGVGLCIPCAEPQIARLGIEVPDEDPLEVKAS